MFALHKITQQKLTTRIIPDRQQLAQTTHETKHASTLRLWLRKPLMWALNETQRKIEWKLTQEMQTQQTYGQTSMLVPGLNSVMSNENDQSTKMQILASTRWVRLTVMENKQMKVYFNETQQQSRWTLMRVLRKQENYEKTHNYRAKRKTGCLPVPILVAFARLRCCVDQTVHTTTSTTSCVIGGRTHILALFVCVHFVWALIHFVCACMCVCVFVCTSGLQ